MKVAVAVVVVVAVHVVIVGIFRPVAFEEVHAEKGGCLGDLDGVVVIAIGIGMAIAIGTAGVAVRAVDDAMKLADQVGKSD